MKMKTISKAIAGLALVAGVSGSASAFTVTVGSYKMIVDSYDAGTLYSASCGGSGATALDIADCDSKGTSNVGSTALGGDSWGILSVSSITNTATNTTEFSRGVNGYLIGTFGGLVDYKVVLSGTTQQAYSTGGEIKLYTSAVDYDPGYGPAAHTDAAIFANLAGAHTLYLHAVFEAAADATEPLSTYQNSFNIATNAGSGSGYLSYIGGTNQFNFDTNTRLTLSGAIADARFTTTINPLDDPLDLGFGKGWLASNSADVRGYAVPEPGSMALVGLGLMGLAGLRRRKQQA